MALPGYRYHGSLLAKKMFAGSLLFAMGIQNALVSIVFGSLVRTTHLTGTFIDLCIEFAQVLQNQTLAGLCLNRASGCGWRSFFSVCAARSVALTCSVPAKFQ
ncbi:DUF1275 family protein [Mucilaginibacter sp. 22184]|uniref:DUF1275 family protein n=1 Tax=Mucilaginibacter sp. 22184 TaxID=3453887 RepID=UPI003F846CBE